MLFNRTQLSKTKQTETDRIANTPHATHTMQIKPWITILYITFTTQCAVGVGDFDSHGNN